MLYGWMKTLIIYLIFSGVVINMSPSGNYKRYINLFTGIIVIIILANPISYIFNLDVGDVDELTKSVGKYMEYSKELSAYGEIYDYYNLSLNEALKIELNEKGYNVVWVKLVTDGELILSCRICCDGPYDGQEGIIWENDLKSYICQVYNVDFDSIYIVRR